MFNLWEIFGMTIFQFLFSANQALSRDLRSFGSENDCSKNPSRQRSIWTMQGPAIVSRQRLSSALLAETHLKIWDSCGTFGSCPSHLPYNTRPAALPHAPVARTPLFKMITIGVDVGKIVWADLLWAAPR